ncbi:MAG: hypothetical protein KDI46_08340 [Alphaproteobacteria bacterium]|nr:hypothetical protein [Alphaproteobacteria bacterium]
MSIRLSESHVAFTLKGTGFSYHYCPSDKMLSINDEAHTHTYISINCAKSAFQNPEEYLQYLDKTNQIKALMFSNNQTVNLAETLDKKRIPAILKHTTRTSLYAYMLQKRRYREFSYHFASDAGIQDIEIKKYTSATNPGKNFYVGRLKTKQNNIVSARGNDIPELFASLSDRTIKDLIAIELRCTHENAAQALLNASTKLGTISRVLDKAYHPAETLSALRKKTETDQQKVFC